MIRQTLTRPATRSAVRSAYRKFSSNPLEADSGGLATRVHHGLMMSLAVGAPIYWMLPQDSSVSRGLGVVLGGSIAAHSWIGLNYVATDYVPKGMKRIVWCVRLLE